MLQNFEHLIWEEEIISGLFFVFGIFVFDIYTHAVSGLGKWRERLEWVAILFFLNTETHINLVRGCRHIFSSPF